MYGQSVGSGPALELAIRLPHLRAVVLHSPILSGLRVMYPVKKTFWFDIYKVSPPLSLNKISLFFIFMIGLMISVFECLSFVSAAEYR